MTRAHARPPARCTLSVLLLVSALALVSCASPPQASSDPAPGTEPTTAQATPPPAAATPLRAPQEPHSRLFPPQPSAALRTVAAYPSGLTRGSDTYIQWVEPNIPNDAQQFRTVQVDHYQGSDSRNTPERVTLYTHDAAAGTTVMTTRTKSAQTGEDVEWLVLSMRPAPDGYLQDFREIEDVIYDAANVWVMRPNGGSLTSPQVVIEVFSSGRLAARYEYQPHAADLKEDLEHFSLPKHADMDFAGMTRFTWTGEESADVDWHTYLGEGSFHLGANPDTGEVLAECGDFVCAYHFDEQGLLAERNIWDGTRRRQRTTYTYAGDTITEDNYAEANSEQYVYQLSANRDGVTLSRQNSASKYVTTYDFPKATEPAQFIQMQEIVTQFGEVSFEPVRTTIISYER